MTTARRLLTWDNMQAIVSMISITVLVVVGLVVIAVSPVTKDTVIPLVSVGVTALVHRPPIQPVAAANAPAA